MLSDLIFDNSLKRPLKAKLDIVKMCQYNPI